MTDKASEMPKLSTTETTCEKKSDDLLATSGNSISAPATSLAVGEGSSINEGNAQPKSPQRTKTASSQKNEAAQQVKAEMQKKRRTYNARLSSERRASKTSSPVETGVQSMSGRKIKRKMVGDDFLTDMKALAPNECVECRGTSAHNARNRHESMLTCAICKQYWHPSCAQISNEMRKVIEVECADEWQCGRCKVCYVCKSGDESRSDILMCSRCDRGLHCHCIQPTPLQHVPEGDWYCMICTDAGHQVRTPRHGEATTTPSLSGTATSRTSSSTSDGKSSERTRNKNATRFGAQMRTDAKKQLLDVKAPSPTGTKARTLAQLRQSDSVQLSEGSDDDKQSLSQNSYLSDSHLLTESMEDFLPPPPPLHRLDSSLPALASITPSPQRDRQQSSGTLSRTAQGMPIRGTVPSNGSRLVIPATTVLGLPRTVATNPIVSRTQQAHCSKQPSQRSIMSTSEAKRSKETSANSASSKCPKLHLQQLITSAAESSMQNSKDHSANRSSDLSDENARFLSYVAKVVRRYNRVNPAALSADDAEVVRGASNRLFMKPEAQCDLRDFMPIPSFNEAKVFVHKSASEVAAWARELNLDEKAVSVIEHECLDGATLWDMSPQEMRALDPALRLGYAYRINQHIRMFKYALDNAKHTSTA